MKVENLMTAEPVTCSTEDSLAAVARRMWNEDCGILPVVDDGKLVGVITDRDIAMALGMRKVPATQVEVGKVITGEVVACSPDDEVSRALEVMGEHQVRRLPVVKGEGLVGLLSLNDIALEARATMGKGKRPTYGMVTKSLQGICEHRNFPVAV